MQLSRFSCKRAALPVLLTAAVLLSVGCGRPAADAIPESVIATIGDQQVLREEFTFYLEANYADQLEAKDPVVLSTILDDYLDQRGLVTALHELGQAPTETEIAEYLKFTGQDQLLKSYDLKQKRMLALNTSLVLAEERLRNLVRDRIGPVTPEEIQAYFERNVNEFLRGETYCFTRYSSSYDDLLKDARYWLVSRKKTDEFIRKRYQDILIEEDCYQVADIPESFLQVLQKLKPGRVSKIVTTRLGTVESYNMFRLREKIPPRKLTLEEVSPMIEQKIRAARMDEAFQAERARLRGRVRITVYPDHILLFNYAGRLTVATGEEE